MKVMTLEEGRQRLASVPVGTERGARPRVAPPTADYGLPKDSGVKTALARLIINGVFADKPVVMMLEETGIWPSSEIESVFVKYRESVSEDRDISGHALSHYPFHFSEVPESDPMTGLIALSLYFIWGVSVFDEAGETLIRTSHDEYIQVGSTGSARQAEAVKMFDEFNLERWS